MPDTLPQPIQTYDAAARWLYDRIDYERSRPDSGQRNPFRLDRTERLLGLIGSPHERIPCVHLAGTKGKGSTAAMLDSILRAAEVKTGLFTSPHLHAVEERMRVGGAPPQHEEFIVLVDTLNTLFHRHGLADSGHIPTFFETTTLLAWLLFDRRQVELAVLETGLGGRLDCTNVCRPLVTLVTSIGLDHTHILGDTLEAIAAEKAGILKAGVPVVMGRLPANAADVVRRQAVSLSCPLHAAGEDFHVERLSLRSPDSTLAERARGERLTVTVGGRSLDNLTLPLCGRHQAENAGMAVMSSLLLQQGAFPQIDETAIRSGLADVAWPLRFELYGDRPTIVLDAAHNPDSIRAVVDTLAEVFPAEQERCLIFGVSADKDADAMLRELIPAFRRIVVTRFCGNPRSVPPRQLAHSIRQLDCGVADLVVAETPAEALAAARRNISADGLICVTGSLFLAAETRAILRQDPEHRESDACGPAGRTRLRAGHPPAAY